MALSFLAGCCAEIFLAGAFFVVVLRVKVRSHSLDSAMRLMYSRWTSRMQHRPSAASVWH